MTPIDATAFLAERFRDLGRDERIEIRPFHPDGKLGPRFWSADPAETARRALALPGPLNVFYSVNPRCDRGGKKAHVTRINGLYADLDFKHFATGEEGAWAVLRSFPIKPTWIIHSGNGLHAYWDFATPLRIAGPDDATIGRVEDLLSRLYAHLGGIDSVQDISRVMRLPGSFNAKGDPPLPVTIVQHNPDARYSLSDFETLLPTPQTAPPPRAGDHHPPRAHDTPSVEEVREMLRYIPPRGDYKDHWLRLLAAVHSAYPGPEGIALCEEWSPGKPGEIAEKFASFGRYRGQRGPATIATVIYEARRGGYEPPRATLIIPPAAPPDTFSFSANGRTPPPGNNGEGHASPGDALPTLDAGDQHLRRITAQVWAALQRANDPPRLFRHGGTLGRIQADERGTPMVVALTDDRLRHELARAADWLRAGKSGPVPALPPLPVVRDLLATPAPPLPILDAITEVPTFAPDGTLQRTPGYHARGRIFYAPPPGFAVPEVPAAPTDRDIARARALIVDDLLGDFPFVGDGERAHAVGLLLLPFARALIDGPTPLHLIEKPQVGTGATLLADMLTYPASGKPLGVMSEGRDEDEWRKRLTARLRSAPTAILIDNIRERLDAAALAAALTSREWEDRLLGTSDTIRVPVRCAWIATGNNPALSSEMARRTVRIRLDARSDQPWLRRDFRHPHLREWATAHRPDLVHAALTLITAWLDAGKPISADAPRLGMFEHWSRVVGGILEVAGIPGLLSNVEALYADADTEGAAIRALLEAWWDLSATSPVTAAELWPVVEAGKVDIDLGSGSERALKIRFGQFLAKLRDRQYHIEAGLVQVVSAGTKDRAAKWKLQPPAKGG